MIAVILAGGGGTRLWPMSRSARPKQFFEITSEDPLIRDTYRRLLRWLPSEKIYFSISPNLNEHIHEIFPAVSDDHILIEPERRETGPAMGFVAALLETKFPDEPVVFVPSDHYIGDEELFLRCLKTGEQLIRETGKLIDIAINPTFPNTGLGYTKIGDKFKDQNGIEVFQFAGHTEKPPYEMAKQYLEEGSYLWHANYYMWTPRKFMQAYDRFAPELAQGFRTIQSAMSSAEYSRIPVIYNQLEKISFDYAVTEKIDPEEVLIIRGDFAWSDIGDWNALYDQLSKDQNNVIRGECVAIDTEGSLIYGTADKLLAVIGMQDVVVVDTGDVTLVCQRKDAQRIREIVNHLKSNDQHTFL